MAELALFVAFLSMFASAVTSFVSWRNMVRSNEVQNEERRAFSNEQVLGLLRDSTMGEVASARDYIGTLMNSSGMRFRKGHPESAIRNYFILIWFLERCDQVAFHLNDYDKPAMGEHEGYPGYWHKVVADRLDWNFEAIVGDIRFVEEEYGDTVDRKDSGDRLDEVLRHFNLYRSAG